ncbi:MAG: cryptochrome/photolyase family protein [Alphaproteobacteria bacterium]|nr:cryptochrome/photolyase family protein [Alphaproteobacteria bacterium]
MGRPACFVAPWDLDRRLAVLPAHPDAATVVLVESVAKGRAMPWHRQKLALVLAAQHHYAEALRRDGYDVEIVHAATFVDGVRDHVTRRGSTEVVAMRPREWGLAQALTAEALGVPLTLHDDGGPGGHFLLPREVFARWAAGQGDHLRMDTFYRWMRKRTGWLMEGARPTGGQWSFDADNRKPPPADLRPPPPRGHALDPLTARVVARVRDWPGLWGSVDGFSWPVTRQAALAELDDFVTHRLARFGDYQDAMLDGEPWMWHGRLSAAMNLSLLHPDEVARAAVDAWKVGAAPLPAVEGVVRQVIGWREFIRGVYWLRMPALRDANLLDAQAPLPDAYWDPDATDLRCVAEAVRAVRDHGYAHHIQRLMVLGNLALLLGVRPDHISHWFWAGFVDAYEWVELPNVVGMAVYADDTFTTKPYAASANYLRRMGDHCGACRYDPGTRHGDDACPFNPLFWQFMVRHRARLSANPRLRALYGTWDRKDAAEQQAVLATAEAAATRLRPAEPARWAWTFDDDAC